MKESCFQLQRKMAKISEKAKVTLLPTPPAPLALQEASAPLALQEAPADDPKVAVRRFFGAAHCCHLCRINEVHDHPTTDAEVLATSACGCCFCVRLYLDRLQLEPFLIEDLLTPSGARYRLTPAQDATLLSELMELQNVNGGRVPIINGLLAPLSETLRYGLACGFYVYKVAGLEMGQYCLSVELASLHNRLPATKDWLAI